MSRDRDGIWVCCQDPNLHPDPGVWLMWSRTNTGRVGLGSQIWTAGEERSSPSVTKRKHTRTHTHSRAVPCMLTMVAEISNIRRECSRPMSPSYQSPRQAATGIILTARLTVITTTVSGRAAKARALGALRSGFKPWLLPSASMSS